MNEPQSSATPPPIPPTINSALPLGEHPDDRLPITDIDDAGIFARPLDDARPRRRQRPEPLLR